MDEFFRNLEEVISKDFGKHLLYKAPFDELGQVLKNNYLDLGKFNRDLLKEASIALGYFFLDFNKCQLSCSYNLGILERIPAAHFLNKQSVSYSSFFSKAVFASDRACFDYKVNLGIANSLNLLLPLDEMESATKDLRRVVFLEREFPGLGLITFNYEVSLDKAVKAENYLEAQRLKDNFDLAVKKRYSD